MGPFGDARALTLSLPSKTQVWWLWISLKNQQIFMFVFIPEMGLLVLLYKSFLNQIVSPKYKGLRGMIELNLSDKQNSSCTEMHNYFWFCMVSSMYWVSVPALLSGRTSPLQAQDKETTAWERDGCMGLLQPSSPPTVCPTAILPRSPRSWAFAPEHGKSPAFTCPLASASAASEVVVEKKESLPSSHWCNLMQATVMTSMKGFIVWLQRGEKYLKQYVLLVPVKPEPTGRQIFIKINT